jgi:hypothetical protein
MLAIANAFRRSSDRSTHAAQDEEEYEPEPQSDRAPTTPARGARESAGVQGVFTVVLQTDRDNGKVKVVDVVDVDGSKPFVVRIKEDKDDDATPTNRKVVLDFAPKKLAVIVKRALNQLRKQYIVAVPWSNVATEGFGYPTGLLYVLHSSHVPTRSFFPVEKAYASGFSMVEIEPVIDRAVGLTLTGEWIAQKAVTEKVLWLRTSLRGPNEDAHLPGLVLSDTLEHLKKHASVLYQNDPMLRTWRVDTIKAHAPHMKLQDGDWVGLFCSDWADVAVETVELSGHKKEMKHYYLVVKYTLPEETVDQLRHVVFENPLNDTWGALVKRKLFSRAEDFATAVRETKLADALSHLGLRPKTANPEVVHSVFNVFDTTPVNVAVSTGDASVGDLRMEETEGVTFYSNCVPTHRCTRGCLVERGPDRDDGLIWLHGPLAGATGGTSWKQPPSVSSLPCSGFNERLKKAQLKSFETAGWDASNGYAKLDALVFV